MYPESSLSRGRFALAVLVIGLLLAAVIVYQYPRLLSPLSVTVTQTETQTQTITVVSTSTLTLSSVSTHTSSTGSTSQGVNPPTSSTTTSAGRQCLIPSPFGGCAEYVP